jgi:hypothetical protein
MAGMIYATTVQDLKRFNWGSPVTGMFARTQTFWSRIFQNTLDRLGPDSDDEDDDDERPVPEERRLHLAVLKPAADPAAPVKITLSTVDIQKAPLYLALSYAWGNSRKVTSYTREDGPPYEDTDTDSDAPLPPTVCLPQKQFSWMARSSPFARLSTARSKLYGSLKQRQQSRSTRSVPARPTCTGAQHGRFK